MTIIDLIKKVIDTDDFDQLINISQNNQYNWEEYFKCYEDQTQEAVKIAKENGDYTEKEVNGELIFTGTTNHDTLPNSFNFDEDYELKLKYKDGTEITICFWDEDCEFHFRDGTYFFSHGPTLVLSAMKKYDDRTYATYISNTEPYGIIKRTYLNMDQPVYHNETGAAYTEVNHFGDREDRYYLHGNDITDIMNSKGWTMPLTDKQLYEVELRSNQ